MDVGQCFVYMCAPTPLLYMLGWFPHMFVMWRWPFFPVNWTALLSLFSLDAVGQEGCSGIRLLREKKKKASSGRVFYLKQAERGKVGCLLGYGWAGAGGVSPCFLAFTDLADVQEWCNSRLCGLFIVRGTILQLCITYLHIPCTRLNPKYATW